MNNFVITQRPTGTKAFVCLDCGRMFARRSAGICPYCDGHNAEHVGYAKMVTTGTERIMQLCTLASADRRRHCIRQKGEENEQEKNKNAD